MYYLDVANLVFRNLDRPVREWEPGFAALVDQRPRFLADVMDDVDNELLRYERRVVRERARIELALRDLGKYRDDIASATIDRYGELEDRAWRRVQPPRRYAPKKRDDRV